MANSGSTLQTAYTARLDTPGLLQALVDGLPGSVRLGRTAAGARRWLLNDRDSPRDCDSSGTRTHAPASERRMPDLTTPKSRKTLHVHVEISIDIDGNARVCFCRSKRRVDNVKAPVAETSAVIGGDVRTVG